MAQSHYVTLPRLIPLCPGWARWPVRSLMLWVSRISRGSQVRQSAWTLILRYLRAWDTGVESGAREEKCLETSGWCMQVSMRLANVWHTGLQRYAGQVYCALCRVNTLESSLTSSRVTGRARASQRERGRKLRRCGHAVSCYLLLPDTWAAWARRGEVGSMPGMSPGNMRSRISTMIHSEYIQIYAMHHMNQFSSSFMYSLWVLPAGEVS